MLSDSREYKNKTFITLSIGQTCFIGYGLRVDSSFVHKPDHIFHFLEVVNMRLEMKSTRYEILTHHKINSVYITFHCRRNKMKFRFWGGPMNTAHSAEANQFCFDEINASANVSVHMI